MNFIDYELNKLSLNYYIQEDILLEICQPVPPYWISLLLVTTNSIWFGKTKCVCVRKDPAESARVGLTYWPGHIVLSQSSVDKKYGYCVIH